jgi:gamma-glutamyl-gamma-aminobutyrate hydrolase PuuD
MKKVLYSVMFGGDGYPFESLAEKVETVRSVSDIKEPDSVMVIWGGADITPTLYGHPQSRTTHPYQSRDALEWASIQRAITMGIPIIGVCRGAQMLCAAAGGFLIQDVRNHAGRGHTITTNKGDVMSVNSIHHQMLAGLENVEHELIAWSTTPLSKGQYIWKDDQVYSPPEGFKEPEFVYFPKIKGYAVQWHPEGMPFPCDATTLVFNTYREKEKQRDNSYA